MTQVTWDKEIMMYRYSMQRISLKSTIPVYLKIITFETSRVLMYN